MKTNTTMDDVNATFGKFEEELEYRMASMDSAELKDALRSIAGIARGHAEFAVKFSASAEEEFAQCRAILSALRMTMNISSLISSKDKDARDKVEVGELQHDSGNWVKFKVTVGGVPKFKCSAKVFDVGSQFGIKGGRVSKLWVADLVTGSCLISYDRGWDIRPQTPLLKRVLQDILRTFPEPEGVEH